MESLHRIYIVQGIQLQQHARFVHYMGTKYPHTQLIIHRHTLINRGTGKTGSDVYLFILMAFVIGTSGGCL